MSRVLLKLSGESFSNKETGFGVDPNIVEQIAFEVSEGLKAEDYEAAAEGRGKFVEGMRNVNFSIKRSDVLPAHISE